MKKTFKIITIFLLLLAVTCYTFIMANDVLIRKSLIEPWDMTNKIGGFYNEAEDMYDVMFFGSSHAYCSFNPLVIYEETHLTSRVLATQQQPLWATYGYIKEALKTQSPSLIVVEVLQSKITEDYLDDGVNYSYMDDIPFSRNKVEMAMASSDVLSDQISYLFPIFKYHTRWEEVKEEDFSFSRGDLQDDLFGYVALSPTFDEVVYTDISDVEDRNPITDKNQSYLLDIIHLCEAEGVDLLLMKSPSNLTVEEKMYFNDVAQIAEDHEVDFVDFNLYYEEIGLNIKTDFYDQRHLNIEGAKKFSTYFAAYLEERPSLTASSKAENEAFEKSLEQNQNLVQNNS